MLFPGSHETSDGNDRCLHNPQFSLAGQESEPSQQKGHGAGHLVQANIIVI